MSGTIYRQKLSALVNAIRVYEGWQVPSEANAWQGSRSWRNHNPGNLRSSPFQSGQRDGFAFFESDQRGEIALYYDIIKKSRGETVTGLNGESTIAELIAVYAPAADNNNVEAYIKAVEELSGLSRETKLKELE